MHSPYSMSLVNPIKTKRSTTVAVILKNQSWENDYQMLKNEIKLRKYSQKTLKTLKKVIMKSLRYCFNGGLNRVPNLCHI